MSVKILVIVFIVISAVTGSFSFKHDRIRMEEVFKKQVDTVRDRLSKFRAEIRDANDIAVLKKHFIACRVAYKRSSILVDYFFPILRRGINGPDLRYSEDDVPDIVHDPHGFQVIERILYSEDVDYTLLAAEIDLLTATFNSIGGQPNLEHKFRDELVLDACKSGVIRLLSLGITGFDSPVALLSVREGVATLEGLEEVVKVMENSEDVLQAISSAKENLLSARNFDAFDRLAFIKNHGDPLYAQITRLAISSGKLLPDERRPLNQFAQSIFSDTLFDINFFSPNKRYQLNDVRVQLGRSLFYDSIFSLSVSRSCASCHHPDKAFTDGLKVPVGTTTSAALKRNTPSLTNVALQTKFFWDSRASTLENQLNSVIHNADEMHGSLKQSIERIKENEFYSGQFAKAYAGDEPHVTEYNISNAIANYLRSLDSLNTKFDRHMRGEVELTMREARGFNLFAGKAKCATCHFLPLFNGLVPPYFTETESEVLGVPATPTSTKVDEDAGKYTFTRSEIHRHAFKTPSLRNVSQTAPYMHNGVFATLEEVMEFYNKGGGAGMGIELDNQTLPTTPLQLTRREINDVIAFLKTLK